MRHSLSGSKRGALVGGGVLALVVAAGCLGEYEGERGAGAAPFAIEGTILKDNAPLAGVTVFFDGPGAPDSVITDAEGEYRQVHFPPGTYTVRPYDGAHDFYHLGEIATPTFILEGDVTACDFEAAPAGSRVDLLSPNGGGDALHTHASTTITFRTRGDPGAEVVVQYTANAGEDEPIWTDITTLKMASALPAGQKATDELAWQEYSVSWLPDTAMPAARIRVASTEYEVLHDESDGSFKVNESASLSGTVTHLGLPISDVLVQLFEGINVRYSTRTDAEGRYAIAGIAPGTYTVQPALTGFSFEASGGNAEVNLVATVPEEGFDFSAIPIGASVIVSYPNSGEVLFSGRPVVVSALCSSIDDYTIEFDADIDGDGTYETVIAQNVEVDSGTASVEWVVPNAELTELTSAKVRARQVALGLQDESNGTFIISPPQRLSGGVTTDLVTGVVDAQVNFSGPNAPSAVMTQADGTWSQESFRFGQSYTVEVSAPATGTAHTASGPGVALQRFGFVSRDLDGDGNFDGVGESDGSDIIYGTSADFPATFTTGDLLSDLAFINFLAAPSGHSIEVLHPRGGTGGDDTDVWLLGYASETIEWAVTGSSAGPAVDVFYSSNAGASWSALPIFSDTPNDGAEDWVVGTQAMPSYAAKMRIVDTTYHLIRAASPESFVLAPSGEIMVEVKHEDNSAFPDVMVSVEAAGYVAYDEPHVDPMRPFLTGAPLGMDTGTFAEGTRRLTSQRVGCEFVESEEVVGGPDAEARFSSVGDCGFWRTIGTGSGDSGFSDPRIVAAANVTAVWTGKQVITWGENNSGYGGVGGTGAIWIPGSCGGSCQSISRVNAPSDRLGHTAVWTGAAMVVWGGGQTSLAADHGMWEPNEDGGHWTALSAVGGPTPRMGHVALWTGEAMVIWGGNNGADLNTGGMWRMSPDGGTWRPMTTEGGPAPRSGASTIWTGERMVVWGGVNKSGTLFNDGFVFTPNENMGAWEPISDIGAPEARCGHTAIWTGSRMVIWGGEGADELQSGGAWSEVTNTWQPTALEDAPSPRSYHTAVWNGSQMLVWGGWDGAGAMASGGRWTPSSGLGDHWDEMPLDGTPTPRTGHVAIWTGNQMAIVGGTADGSPSRPGLWTQIGSGGLWEGSGTLIPSVAERAIWTGHQMLSWCLSGGIGQAWTPCTEGGGWSNLGAVGVPSARSEHTMLWADDRAVAWGGKDAVQVLGDGGSFVLTPQGGLWDAIPPSSMVSPRAQHTAVWTGTHMAVWGGAQGEMDYLGDGAQWNPATGLWHPISDSDAPSPRIDHSAIWTGTEMIIWGGVSESGEALGDGGAWDAANNTWTPISTASGALSARGKHSAVWTGTRMLAWGGLGAAGGCNDGAAWDPATNSWTVVQASDVLEGTYCATAAWTGAVVLIWGGVCGIAPTDAGGIWNPSDGSWLATSVVEVPSARYSHNAIWTGTSMVIWGGHTVDTGGIYTPPSNCGAVSRIREVGFPVLPHAAIPMSNAQVLTLSSNNDSIDTRIYCAPNATIEVHNNPTPTQTVTSDMYPDYWRFPAEAQLAAPEGVFGVAAAYISDHSGVCVWGGRAKSGDLAPGGSFFDATTCTWTTMSQDTFPEPRMDHIGISLGSRFFVWGGSGIGGKRDDGGIYDPTDGTWTWVTDDGAPTPRVGHGAAYDPDSGNVYVFGGIDSSGITNTGGVYDANSGFSWSTLTTDNAPSPRTDAFVFWSEAADGQLVVWGGGWSREHRVYCDGGTFDGTTWTPIAPHDDDASKNAPPDAMGRKACINPQNGHLLVYGGLTTHNATTLVYDHHLYDFDPDTRTWAKPQPWGDPCQPQMDFTLIHTGLGTRNNVLTIGGHVGGEPVSGFIR